MLYATSFVGSLEWENHCSEKYHFRLQLPLVVVVSANLSVDTSRTVAFPQAEVQPAKRKLPRARQSSCAFLRRPKPAPMCRQVTPRAHGDRTCRVLRRVLTLVRLPTPGSRDRSLPDPRYFRQPAVVARHLWRHKGRMGIRLTAVGDSQRGHNSGMLIYASKTGQEPVPPCQLVCHKPYCSAASRELPPCFCFLTFVHRRARVLAAICDQNGTQPVAPCPGFCGLKV